MVDVAAVAGGQAYRVVGAELTAYRVPETGQTSTTGRPLDVTVSGDRLLLTDGGSLVAALFATGGVSDQDGQQLSGQVYLLATTAGDFARDLDPLQRGFQGQITLTVEMAGNQQDVFVVDVAAGYSAQGADAVGAADGLDVLRAQQRLNYLGFGGEALPLDNTLSLPTAQALRLFQAAVNDDGTAQPADMSGQLDADTVAWLNATSAPRWAELDVLPAEVAQRYGTDGLVDSLREMIDEPANDFTAADVKFLSSADGWASMVGRSGSPIGREHLCGMEVDLAVPAGAETASGEPGLSADEQWLVDRIVELHDRAAERGLVLAAVGTTNAKVRNAVNALYADVATDQTEQLSLLHMGFAAPRRPTC